MGDLLANPQVLRPHQEPRTRRRRVRDFLGRWFVGTVVLTLTFLFAPGMSATGLLSIPFAVLITAGMGRLLRPLLIRIARPLGWFGAVLLALFANAITMYVGLELTPGIQDGGPCRSSWRRGSTPSSPRCSSGCCWPMPTTPSTCTSSGSRPSGAAR
jgi:uncharacterized membrane protein YvlD (DUF360 family)